MVGMMKHTVRVDRSSGVGSGEARLTLGDLQALVQAAEGADNRCEVHGAMSWKGRLNELSVEVESIEGSENDSAVLGGGE